MSAPICHRTIAPTWRFGNEATREDAARARYPETASCIGSACALWVPEVLNGCRTHAGPDDFTDFHSVTRPDADLAPTGRGWCAENTRRTPWADPAKVAQ